MCLSLLFLSLPLALSLPLPPISLPSSLSSLSLLSLSLSLSLSSLSLPLALSSFSPFLARSLSLSLLPPFLSLSSLVLFSSAVDLTIPWLTRHSIKVFPSAPSGYTCQPQLPRFPDPPFQITDDGVFVTTQLERVFVGKYNCTSNDVNGTLTIDLIVTCKLA